uniref:C-type lectin domain-containing protein n=1 Tax=Periophthalmus magnuspinnatus TaxID=409849 RepID=A0A3B4BG57_9GOBI
MMEQSILSLGDADSPIILCVIVKLTKVTRYSQCPPGWLPNRRHCYTVEKKPLAWSQARQSCSDRAAGSHLADLKTRQDLYFITSHLMSLNSLLLLWTALNDRLVIKSDIFEGKQVLLFQASPSFSRCFLCIHRP